MIHIYVGENGSGKSKKLGEIATNLIAKGETVIAISTAPNDKFPRRTPHKPYHYMGSRLGRFVAREAIKSAISYSYGHEDKLFSSIFNILNYAGFSQKFGLTINGLRENIESELMNHLLDSDSESGVYENYDVISNSFRYIRSTLKPDHTFWVDQETPLSKTSGGEALVNLVKHEKLCKKIKLFRSIEIVVQKKDIVFPLIQASSGELSLISTAVFIASNLHDSNARYNILIDEPENSLHPEWQQKYITNLQNLFPYYKTNFYIATHSPLLVAGGLTEKNVSVYRASQDQFIEAPAQVKNIEDALIDQFGIVTPESNALSERCIELIHKVEIGQLTKEDATESLDSFYQQSYDTKQREFLIGVRNIILELEMVNAKD
ncbi:AAA family ATPase [Vibrio parahaemolyticus]|uniref:AAA family ATPase n=1 Tax=Vibrio TaxID=662 RepID=UPI0011104DA9|nr:AAA family ATPase [Vibrio parahaemolyticus]MDF4878951.1 AAA family ATPase [Vibrio parahaemolyticus]MDF5390786.1 AAA family ATPase [Vibrio parahaemolyticus]MDF5397344.1 AAA family ATPase [Vibrio parahaemolyticus]QRH14565.1 ATP-binding protein [Vibrio parahaemolyticus]TMX41477.1 hypothetical protein DA098_00230 [Vibrio parahaemolyticus]